MNLKSTTENRKSVLLCGGGNAIHVLSAYISSHKEYEVNILSLFPGEAQRLQNSIPPEGIRCIDDLKLVVCGKPNIVTDDPKRAQNADVVIFALPNFAHDLYLQALKPFIKEGITLGAMPGEGGFDMCVHHNLGSEFFKNSNIFALETLPWACRIEEYGRFVQVLGTKKKVEVAVSPKMGELSQVTLNVLHSLIGCLPELKLANNFLSVTLMNPNSLAHPTISYGFYRDKDVNDSFDEPPLFYQGADNFTCEKLAKLSDEVLEIGRALKETYPTLDLSTLCHLSEWIIQSYGDSIGDKRSIYAMLQSTPAWRGLKHPMIAVKTDNGIKFVPNFKYRYFTEDLPCGLVVTKGIASLAGVKTPHMDEVILWCQKMLGKEYIVDGELKDSFMKMHNYIAEEAQV